MKITKTYQLVILHDSLAFEDNLQEKFKSVFLGINEKEYLITITYTPLLESKFSTTIIILKETLEAALPICETIYGILKQNGYNVHRQESILLWGDDAPRFSAKI